MSANFLTAPLRSAAACASTTCLFRSQWWRSPAIPDRLREEALHKIFARVVNKGSQLLAVHPQPNENAWLLGLAALRQEQHVGLVGARGIAPHMPTSAWR